MKVFFSLELSSGKFFSKLTSGLATCMEETALSFFLSLFLSFSLSFFLSFFLSLFFLSLFLSQQQSFLYQSFSLPTLLSSFT
jgi:hypothetical protein